MTRDTRASTTTRVSMNTRRRVARAASRASAPTTNAVSLDSAAPQPIAPGPAASHPACAPALGGVPETGLGRVRAAPGGPGEPARPGGGGAAARRGGGQTARGEPPLVLGVRELECPLVCRARLVRPVEAAEEVRPRRMEIVVAVELEPVGGRQPGFGAGRLGERDRAVELDHRRAGQSRELAVQGGDLR